MKDKFISLLTEVDRTGIDLVLTWLDTNGFYEAPASTKFHGAHEGGLVQHSLNVAKAMLTLNKMFTSLIPGWSITRESCLITSLLHDVNKVNFYVPGWKDGTYRVEDKLPMGHGEKSLYSLLRCGLDLTDEEALAIRWHMGAFDSGTKGYPGEYAFNNAFNIPLVRLLHLADLSAVMMENESKNKEG